MSVRTRTQLASDFGLAESDLVTGAILMNLIDSSYLAADVDAKGFFNSSSFSGNLASASVSGFMSSTDKAKLDGLNPVISATVSGTVPTLLLGATGTFDLTVTGATTAMKAIVNCLGGLPLTAGYYTTIPSNGVVRMNVKALLAVSGGSQSFQVLCFA